MRTGHTASCGCLKREKSIEGLKNRKLPGGQAGFNRIYAQYKNKNAERRKLNFELSKEEFKEITQKDCFYCGSKPLKNEQGYLYNGIDRVDNNEGYKIDNVVTCCYRCNIAKASMTKKEFFEWIQKLYNNLKLRSFV